MINNGKVVVKNTMAATVAPEKQKPYLPAAVNFRGY